MGILSNAQTTVSGLIFAAMLASASSPAYAEGPADRGLNDSKTRQVVHLLEEDFAACSDVALSYLPDCYRRAFGNASALLTDNAAYWEAEIALSGLSRSFGSFVRAHENPDQPRIGGFGSRLRGVRADDMVRAMTLVKQEIGAAEADLRRGTPAEIRYFAPIADLLGEALKSL